MSAKQTDPPSIPIVELYPTGNFPTGEIKEYTESRFVDKYRLNYTI